MLDGLALLEVWQDLENLQELGKKWEAKNQSNKIKHDLENLGPTLSEMFSSLQRQLMML